MTVLPMALWACLKHFHLHKWHSGWNMTKWSLIVFRNLKSYLPSEREFTYSACKELASRTVDLSFYSCAMRVLPKWTLKKNKKKKKEECQIYIIIIFVIIITNIYIIMSKSIPYSLKMGLIGLSKHFFIFLCWNKLFYGEKLGKIKHIIRILTF